MPSIRIGKTSIGGGSSSLYWTPQNVIITQISGGNRISWEDNSTDETGFQIWVSVNGGIATLLGTVLANITSYDDLTVYSIGDIVTYMVRAAKGFTYSDFSEASTQITEPAIPAILEDGNTIYFGDFQDDAAFTLNGTKVASWGNKLGGVVALANSTDAERPVKTADGVLFQNKSLTTGALVYPDPHEVYMVARINSASNNNPYLLSFNNGDGVLIGQEAAYQGVRIYPAAASSVSLTYNQWYIIEISVVGQWGKQEVTVDGVQKVYRDIWAPSDPSGLKLGDARLNQPCNFEVKGIIARKIINSAENKTIVREYLTEKYAL